MKFYQIHLELKLLLKALKSQWSYYYDVLIDTGLILSDQLQFRIII